MLDALFGQFAGWFSAPALIGTAFFLLRLLVPGGGDHDAGGDAGGDVGGDAGGAMDAHAADVHAGAGDGHHDAPSGFRMLSVQAICAFLMGFGWTGFAAYRGTGFGPGFSALIGLGGGVAMMMLLGFLLRSALRLESSGNVSIHSAMGRDGEVYVTVPAAGAGRGQVRVVIGDRQRIFNAVSSAGEIRPPTRVKVVRVNDDRSLTVAPANREQ